MYRMLLLLRCLRYQTVRTYCRCLANTKHEKGTTNSPRGDERLPSSVNMRRPNVDKFSDRPRESAVQRLGVMHGLVFLLADMLPARAI